MFPVLVIPALSLLVVACATKLTWPETSFAALLGLRRQTFISGGLVYVSRGILFPTAIFWYGGRPQQYRLVARAIAAGRIARFDPSDAETTASFRAGVACWPTAECRDLFGKPGDTIPPE